MTRLIASDGAVIAYSDEGNGRPLLLLHGLNAHGGLFTLQAEALRDRFRVIRPDFRGHGDTPTTHEPDIARLAADIAELTEHLDLHGVIGVGWSLGAMVLWELLRGAHADRFAGQVVVDMSPKVFNDETWQFGLINPAMREPAIGETRQKRGERIARLIVATGSADEALVAWLGPYLADADLGAVASLGRSLTQQDYRSHLRSMTVPTLVVHGLNSRFYPDGAAHFITGSVAQARATGFKHSGHAPHVEEPALFNQAVADFAREIAAQSAHQ